MNSSNPNHYNPTAIETAVQSAWNNADVYRVNENTDKPKFYACSMLPYPSGKLHMGHVRNYTINDLMTRHLRMKGYNVLMPMGWDAFGMPAENAALKNKVPPAQWTYDNIAYMKKQMQAMGLAIDWSREFATCQPEYYKWNQWLFLKMLEKGIAYRKTQTVNWDPVDQTVLANEQVIDGRGWRSGALVEKREIPGYYLNISSEKYAEELLSGLEDLGWPERVKLMQENWIGKSHGVRFAFTHDIRDAHNELVQDGKMYVFTTRADTIMGVTFCAVAAEHPLAAHAATLKPELNEFIEKCKRGSVMEADMATMEKEGVDTGLFVTHPLTNEQVPVWIGNYVLMSYGDGAVMAVPAHDERDFAFAKKYDLPIKQVVQVSDKDFSTNAWQEHYADKENCLCINSGAYNGLNHKDAIQKIASDLAAKNLGELKTTYRLRDWGISRQRYWGTPIPLIHCESCGVVPVPEKDLPVKLPEDCIPDGTGNPLNKREDFLHVDCPQCGKAARRETDTMDTFVDSCWYYMRYTCPDASTMVDARNDYWMPMDQYIGGIEHAILHLLYARFWTKVMRDLGLVKFNEPFKNLLTQGMVLNETYYRENPNGSRDWFNPADVDVTTDAKGKILGAVLREDGQPVQVGGVEKMAKSKNNGIDPQALIEQYGADTARFFTMFAAPPEQTLEWSDSGVEGSHRFLKRVWNFTQKHSDALQSATSNDLSQAAISAAASELRLTVHSTLKQISYDLERVQYNTVASGNMKLLNALEGFTYSADAGDQALLCEGVSILLRTLYPICPHVTAHLWQTLGFEQAHGCGIIDAPWPLVDETALTQSDVTYIVQVNGKLRDKLTAPAAADNATLQELALQLDNVQKFIDGQAVKKFIVVPKKLINIVV